MRYYLGGLGAGLAALIWVLASTVPPVAGQAPPTPPDWSRYAMADCAPGQPHFTIRRPAEGQATGLVQAALATDMAHPPLRCAQPRTDADLLTDAQSHLARLQAALLDAPPEDQPAHPPRLHGPFSPNPGQLRQMMPERTMKAFQRWRDDGSEVFFLLECDCNSGLLGLRLGYAELLILRYYRDVPGPAWAVSPVNDGFRRLSRGALR